MDAGIATPDTTVYDRALIQDEEGNPWPMNDGKYPTGRAMTVKGRYDAFAQYHFGTAAQTADSAEVLRIHDAAAWL